ncbi:hypothetical protein BU198_31855 [Streptomyces sp. CBMA156]|nr:hypothetical protein [Streptomyces sp. CBMA156]
MLGDGRHSPLTTTPTGGLHSDIAGLLPPPRRSPAVPGLVGRTRRGSDVLLADRVHRHGWCRRLP